MTDEERRAALTKVATSDPDASRRAKASEFLVSKYGADAAPEFSVAPRAEDKRPGPMRNAVDYVGQLGPAAEVMKLPQAKPQSPQVRDTGLTEDDVRDIVGRGEGKFGQFGADAAISDQGDRRRKLGLYGGLAAGAGAGALAAGALAPLAAVAPVASAAVTGGVAGAAGAATNAAATGEPIVDAAISGGKSGLMLGGGGALLGELASVPSAIAKTDPWIARRAAADESGALADAKALPRGQKGIQKVQENSLDRVAARHGELDAEASRDYGAIVGPRKSLPVDRKHIVDKLEAARTENLDPDTGLPMRDSVDRKLRDAADMTAPSPTVGGSLARRKALKTEASFGSNAPTPDQQAARDTYHAFRGGVRIASPEVAAADDAYTAHAARATRRKQILKLGDDAALGAGPKPGSQTTPGDAADDYTAEPALSPGEETAAARLLGRAGDTNKPGLEAERYIAELAKQDPEFAAAIDAILNKKALELTRFGMPADAPSFSSALTLGGAVRLGAQNARAIGTHLVEPMSNAAAGAARTARHLAPAFSPLDAELNRRK